MVQYNKSLRKHRDMKAFIWDLDGTLLDSYEAIVSDVLETCRSFGLPMERENAHRQVILHSVMFYLEDVSKRYGVSFEDMKTRYSKIAAERKAEIRSIPHAKAALETLQQDAVHFVFTHRGESTAAILQELCLDKFFTEIVTSQNGFPRKPEPDAVRYLIRKYHLDPYNTYYVGDRTIDMDCAKNACIQGILFLPEGSYCVPNGSQTCIVHNLMEIAKN